jgi:hypothetical protein
MTEYNIYDYSNPRKVKQLVKRYLGKDVELYLSTRKFKKYMIQNPDGEWIHFGQYPYEDYTKHKDPQRREDFRKRNVKWAIAPKWSPAWLSWYLLW